MIYTDIKKVIDVLKIEIISEERKTVLQPLIDFIQLKKNNHKDIRLNFICTHNSRRSHLSQVWAQTMASYFNLKNVFCYSGGTEATALFPMVAETLIVDDEERAEILADTTETHIMPDGSIMEGPASDMEN